MSKLYRFEVETLWIHPEGLFAKESEMVYDFREGELVSNERSWFNGQDFFNPKRTPSIYADWDKAELAYTNLEWLQEDWGPMAWMKGSTERIKAFRLISVDEYGNEKVEAENNFLANIIAFSEAACEMQPA